MKKLLIAAVLLVLSIGVAPSLAGDARTTATPPANTATPTISGSAQEGKTLTASSGSWSGTNPITFTYQWQRCSSGGSSCAPIRRETAQTYTVTSDDVTHTLDVIVTAHNAGGTGSKESAPTAVVAGATPPSNTALPAISGNPDVGWTLKTNNGTWTGTTPIAFTYQWRRCAANGASCVDISGATTSGYQLTNADAGHTMRVAITATNVGGTGQATSNATNAIIVTAPGNTTAPAVTGTLTQGQTLTVTAGEWIGGTPLTYVYAWQRCDASGNNCAAIADATKTTYVLAAADAGHDLRVAVTASNSAGKSTANSNTVGPIGSSTPAPPPPPSGTSKLPNGETSITASNVPDTDRLTVISVKFQPAAITGRAPVTATFKVVENNKYDVAGALVYVLPLPGIWAKASPEATTAADGTVSITITPTAKAPKSGSLTLFVRVRTPQGNLLAGSSGRRLVSVRMRP